MDDFTWRFYWLTLDRQHFLSPVPCSENWEQQMSERLVPWVQHVLPVAPGSLKIAAPFSLQPPSMSLCPIVPNRHVP